MTPAVSASMVMVAVTILPDAINFLMSSVVLTPMRCERSLTVMPSCTLMTFFSSAISVIWVFWPFLVGFFFLPRIGIDTRPKISSR